MEDAAASVDFDAARTLILARAATQASDSAQLFKKDPHVRVGLRA